LSKDCSMAGLFDSSFDTVVGVDNRERNLVRAGKSRGTPSAKVTASTQGPRIARATPPGFHEEGAGIHEVTVMRRAWLKCSFKMDETASWIHC
jgi:hypothetical protein